MKAIIQAIIREISALSLPMAPELVLDVFTRYPEPVSTSLPNDLIAICTQLDVVKKLAQQGRELQMKIKDLELHKKNLELHNKEVEDYSKEGIVLQHQLSLLEDDLQKLQDSISSTRAELTELYNLVIKEMQKDQFTISETVPESITHKQLTNIVDIFNQLVSEFRRLNLPLAKLDLLKLKKQQSELVSQMNKHLHINGLAIALPKENNLNLWKLLQSNLTHSIQKWKDLKPKLDSLQEEFATCLSTSDAQRKISTLENNKVKLVNELNQLAQQIKLHELRPEIQRELTVQFQQSSSVDEQLKNYETKIDSFLAYVDPHSWLEWYQNKPQYTKQQKEYSQRLSFLTLLKEQKEKIVHLDELIASIDVLTKITNSNLMSLETENLLISQAIILLNELPQCKVPLRFDKFTAADYYILLIDNIFLVPESIRKDENLLALVNEFLPVLIKIVEYREKYTLLVEQDSYIPTIEELQQVVPEEIIIEQKRKQLQTCQLYMKKIQLLFSHIKSAEEQVAKVNTMKIDVDGTLVALNRALENKKKLQIDKPFSEQIQDDDDEINAHVPALAQCQNDIAEVMNKIASLNEVSPKIPLVATDLSAENLPSTTVVKQEVVLLVNPIDTGSKSTVSNLLNLEICPPSLTSSIGLEIIREQIDEPIQREIIAAAVILDSSVQDLSINPSADNLLQKEDRLVDLTRGEVDSSVTPVDEPTLISPLHTSASKELIESPLKQELSCSGVSSHVEKVITSREVVKPSTIVESGDAGTEVPVKQVIPVKQTIPPNTEDSLQLLKWHTENIKLLEQHSEELKIWYFELYSVANSQFKQTSYSYQYSHLIRDIWFELQFKKESEVLSSYMKLCPKPLESCIELLELKPSYKISPDSVEKLIAAPSLPIPLQKLHLQYQNLKKRQHPVVGDLLLHMIESLEHIYKEKTQDPATLIMPKIMNDPRYDILKKHRGIGKIWEAIEDLWCWIMCKINGKPEYEYSKRPSFFAPNTVKLLTEAESFVLAAPVA